MHSYISSPAKTAQILSQYKINLKKSKGQNFLVDTNVAKKIVRFADIRLQDVLLEVGSGIGSLTEIILSQAKKVICIEIDRLLAKAFEDIFKSEVGRKIELIKTDALKVDYSKISKRYNINKMVSNLPYKIAAPLILKILLEADSIQSFFVTIQKDIADRLVARTGDKNYSSYTLKANFLADFNICFLISRNCFMPKPFVDSALVKVTRKDRRAILGEISSGKISDKIDCNNYQPIIDFFNFIDSCFLHRRKKIINSLLKSSSEYVNQMDLIFKLLSQIGKSKNVRAEELDLKDYIFLYKNLKG